MLPYSNSYKPSSNSNKKVVRSTRISYGYSEVLSVVYSDGSYEHINLKTEQHPLALKRQQRQNKGK